VHDCKSLPIDDLLIINDNMGLRKEPDGVDAEVLRDTPSVLGSSCAPTIELRARAGESFCAYHCPSVDVSHPAASFDSARDDRGGGNLLDGSMVREHLDERGALTAAAVHKGAVVGPVEPGECFRPN
jgi:hypothetical protein